MQQSSLRSVRVFAKLLLVSLNGSRTGSSEKLSNVSRKFVYDNRLVSSSMRCTRWCRRQSIKHTDDGVRTLLRAISFVNFLNFMNWTA